MAGDCTGALAQWWSQPLCARGMDDVHGKQEGRKTFLQAPIVGLVGVPRDGVGYRFPIKQTQWINLKQVTAICPLCFVLRHVACWDYIMHRICIQILIVQSLKDIIFFDAPLLPFHHPSVSVDSLGCVVMVMTFLFMTQVWRSRRKSLSLLGLGCEIGRQFGTELPWVVVFLFLT